MEKKTIGMNRLILIGNGFDLAHGFKTSYQDFILDYFKEIIESFVNKGKEHLDDELFTICYSNHYQKIIFNEKIIISNLNDVQKFFDRHSKDSMITIKFNSFFFKKLFNSLKEYNWVDIENEYFEVLNSKKVNLELVRQLNSDFNCLKVKLENYLQKLNLNQYKYHYRTFSTLFSEQIKKEDIVTIKLDENINPKSLYFLNFNYTSTFEHYFGHTQISLKDLIIDFNYIHGELGNNKNPPIFGFGDELDRNYLEFEYMNNNDLFTHIKSFKYSQTENYHDLIRFIESEKFQVYIIGHSCGLSDRTMLNHIFEHENCKSLKIFYHQKPDEADDFTEKTYEISRHFKNKGLMRKKLVPKSKSRPLPKPRKII